MSADRAWVPTNRWARAILKYRPQIVAILLLCLISTLLVSVRESSAIPAWARKYNADCAMCHYAAYPRLNSFGLQFRRMGYRTPVEINKDQEISNVNNFLAGRIREQFIYNNTSGTKERTEFQTPEISLIYGGAFSRHFSGYARASSDGTNTPSYIGQLIGLYGNVDNFVTLRGGLMSSLLFTGVGGFDRPVGLSVPAIYASPITRNSSSGTLPTLNTFIQAQRGAELSYVHGPSRFFAQVTNGFDQNGSSTAHVGDIDPNKDFLVGYDHILDEIASGFTLFYYNGTTHGSVIPATGVPVNTSNTMSFWRLGLNVNKIFTMPGLGFFELLGGYVRSKDNVPAPPPGGRTDVQGNAGYIESQQYITGPELTFYERFSIIDSDVPLKHSTRKDYTIGVVTPVETWLRLAAEYTYTENALPLQVPGLPAQGRTAHVTLLEVQAAW